MKSYFLLKTEPSTYSIDDLKKDKKTSWGGVRNFQVRNIIRDEMKKGDLCIIYHSSCDVPSAVGVGEIVKGPYADPLQFDPTSEYFDKTAKKDGPRWYTVEVKFTGKFKNPLSLTQMRTMSTLADMRLLAKGNRLSVMPISKKHFEVIATVSAETLT